jgi:hypothetical protein
MRRAEPKQGKRGERGEGKAGFHDAENAWVGEGRGCESKRIATGRLQGCELDGLGGGGVIETEMKRLVLFGGESVASYSKKFLADLKYLTEIGNDSCQVRPSVEIQKLGVLLRGFLMRNEWRK